VRTELLLLIEVRPPARRGTLHAGAGVPLCATRVCASQAVWQARIVTEWCGPPALTSVQCTKVGARP